MSAAWCLVLNFLYSSEKKVFGIKPEDLFIKLLHEKTENYKEMRIFQVRETPSMYLLYSLVVTSAAW